MTRQHKSSRKYLASSVPLINCGGSHLKVRISQEINDSLKVAGSGLGKIRSAKVANYTLANNYF